MSNVRAVDTLDTPVIASAAQQRLWFLDQLNPGDTSYNMSQGYRLLGKLDREALRKSIDAIIARHSALRTTFEVRNHVPVQIVHDRLTIELPLNDLSASGSEVTGADIQALLDEELSRPFDLVKGPLFRASLFKLSENDHLLLVSQHHMVFDRTSVGLFVDELATLYEGLSGRVAGIESRLPALSIQYADYTKWRAETNRGDTLNKPLAYWRDKLAGVAPLELPTDRPRSKFVTTRGEQQFLDLPEQLVTGISDIAGANGATRFIGLLAAFKILLHQWTGNTDILIGTPFADRRLQGTKELLGFFVNHIVLRTQLADDSDFLDFLRDVRQTCFDAYRNSAVPFDKLVEELRPVRQENRNPLFDVQFAYQARHSQLTSLGDMSVVPLTPNRNTSQYDITFTVRELEQGFDMRIEYRTDLFDAASMQRLMRRFRSLLEEIVTSPARRLSELPLVGASERRLLLEEWNDTGSEYPDRECIHSLISEQARRTPDAIAVTSAGQSITYDELDRCANQLAHHLIDMGCGAETIVAICLERSIDMVVGLLGILKSGAAYLPLDRTYPDERLKYMLEDSRAFALVTQSDYADQLPAVCANRVLLDTDAAAIGQRSAAPPEQRAGPENLCYVIYTSGSTGKPKGVQLEHRNVVNFLCTMQKSPGMVAEDVLLAVTTLSFDIAVLEIYLPLITGACTVIASHQDVIDGDRLRGLLIKENVSLMQATPVTWRMLIDAGWKGNMSFKVLCGGEAMPRDLAEELVPRAAEVWNMYGPTETTVWSTCFKLDKDVASLSIGKPIGNTSIYILDRFQRPVPLGRAGELYIGGDGVARGYLNRPELTQERFVADPFRGGTQARMYATGDEVRYLPDGNVEYLNRLDNQVKVRGYRIELGEIEAEVSACAGIKQAVVTVREDTPGDRRIAAYYVSETLGEVDGNDIRGKLRESLPAYMIPQFFIELEEMPLTLNGKVDRKALPAPDFGGASKSDNYVAPRTKYESAIAAIWQELLGLETVGVHDNFVELGGHSLLALRAMSRIKQELGATISAMSMIMDSLEQIAAQFDEESPVSVEEAGRDATASEATPFYFGPGQSLLGIHHSPAAERLSKGSILLCSPVFTEGIKANWALKRLADQLTKAGYHVLRFDYFGTGDSLGDGTEGNAGRWMQDVAFASDALIKRSGCDTISIIGLRFGATLAALSAVRGVDRFVLWDPIFNGKEYMAYLRERHESMISSCNSRRSQPVHQGHHEILGFYCSPECRTTIESCELHTQHLGKNDKVIIVLPESLPQAELIKQECLSLGPSHTCHIVDDARCDIDNAGRLSAFLPGPSLRVILSEFSGNR